jgi:hypothetical protein
MGRVPKKLPVPYYIKSFFYFTAVFSPLIEFVEVLITYMFYL